jgi:hypothetical protein
MRFAITESELPVIVYGLMLSGSLREHGSAYTGELSSSVRVERQQLSAAAASMQPGARYAEGTFEIDSHVLMAAYLKLMPMNSAIPAPANTPERVACSSLSSIPLSTSASVATSRDMRCCGSISKASFFDILK